MNIKYLNLAAAFLFAAGFSSATFAAVIPAGPKTDSFLGYNVDNVSLQDGNLVTEISLDFSQVNLPKNSELVFTPRWVNGSDTVSFTAFAVAGRTLYYDAIRNGQKTPFLFKGWGKDRGELSKESEPVSNSLVSLSVPYRDWMETATFLIDVIDIHCTTCRVNKDEFALAQTDFTPRVYEAEFIYVTPAVEEVKTREISARAYIDFPVNRIEIYPDYRRNPEELAKIRHTIDSVNNDKDIRITSLHISGTASPEGSYQNNIRLAKGRTESLKDYVQGLYKFQPGFITTSFEPVDWQGLAEFLKVVNGYMKNSTDAIRNDQFQNIDFNPATIQSILPNATEILGIVMSDIEPYARNSKIKTTYPDQYQWLLTNVYPALRHSDYRIEFEIKNYYDAAEIIEVMQTQPQKLSLSELFIAASSQEEGSDLYNEAMEIAVKMYPQDKTANLNAGLAAMKRGDFVTAQKYLEKAGDTPEAEYAKAVLTELQGNDEDAYRMFLNLQNSSDPVIREKSKKAAEQIAAKIDFKGNFTTLM